MTTLEKLRMKTDYLLCVTKEAYTTLDEDAHYALADQLKNDFCLVDAALKAVEDEARWIPVEERLPEESEDDEGYPRLLVMDSNGHVAPAIFHAETQCFEVYRIFGKENAYLRLIAGAYDFVTHWRPLPEGPGEEAQE